MNDGPNEILIPVQEKVENKVEEKKEVKQEGKSISNLVNKELADNLVQFGFPQAVAEKALFLTGNKNIEDAINWIETHQNDPDYLEELRIVEKTEDTNPNSVLSEEEAAKKAKELQRIMREKHLKKEKEDEEEKEKNRKKNVKEISEAKAKLQELEMKKAAEERKKDKIEFEQAKKKMMEQLQRDKEERFGKKFEKTVEVKKENQQTKIETLKKIIKTMVNTYISGDELETCFKTLKIYLSNILKDPNELKFRKINKNNEGFKIRIAKIIGGLNILKELGFQDNSEGFLELGNPNIELIKETLAIFPNY